MHLEGRGQLILESIPVERISRLTVFRHVVWGKRILKKEGSFIVYFLTYVGREN